MNIQEEGFGVFYVISDTCLNFDFVNTEKIFFFVS